jgi:hypothetical protein
VSGAGDGPDGQPGSAASRTDPGRLTT